MSDVPTKKPSFISRFMIAMRILFGVNSSEQVSGTTDTSRSSATEPKVDILETHYTQKDGKHVLSIFKHSEVGDACNSFTFHRLLSNRAIASLNDVVLRNMADEAVGGYLHTGNHHTCPDCDALAVMTNYNLLLAPILGVPGDYKLILTLEHINLNTDVREEVSLHLVYTVDRESTENSGIVRKTFTLVYPDHISNAVMNRILAFGSQVIAEIATYHKEANIGEVKKPLSAVVQLHGAKHE